MFISEIYPITDSKLTNLSHAEQVEQLISGGAKIIQLREKHAVPRDFFQDAMKALEIARRHHVKIIINDRVDLALMLNADGVHLGQEDLSPLYAREMLGENAIIGFSTHSLTQVFEALKLPLDYLAIGPIFPTNTKENPEKTVGLEIIPQVKNLIRDLPLVAIGGINAENADSVFQAGADSVAVINAVLSNPLQIAEKMKNLCSMRQQNLS